MQPPHPLVARLVQLEPIKTWSLIVTLFGDLDGDEMTGAHIRVLLGHIGIKPEAIRVALHRLKGDGWITSARRGREAVYRLSAGGREETEAATTDVYREDVKYPEGWQFHLMKEMSAPSGSVALTKDVILVPTALAVHVTGSLRLVRSEQDLPAWIEECLVPQPLVRNAAALITVLRSAPRTNVDRQILDRIALRLLVLHHWRRVALRPGSWAHIGLLPSGTLATCQGIVTPFLKRGVPISLRRLTNSA